MQFDTVIIGSGIAGLNTALICAKYGSVCIVTKSKITDSLSNLAQGGISGAKSSNDSEQTYTEDTLKAGKYLNDRKSVDFLVKNASNAILELDKMGVPFDKENGSLNLALEAGHSVRRIAHVKDQTGKAITKTLVQNVKHNKNIKILENTYAIDLEINQNQCVGVYTLNRNKISVLKAKTVIIATGGLGQIYSKTTNTKQSTGDGIALGINAGIKTQNMEFIQFHPTVFFSGKKAFLLSEALRGENAKIVDETKKQFLQNEFNINELTTRDELARAIFIKNKSSKTYLKLNSIKIKDKFPHIAETLKKQKLNLEKDYIPFSAAEHFSCGGLKTNIYCQTKVKNLFAIGEVACNGVHGANRLASNSLLECVVFGKNLEKKIKKFIQKKSFQSFSEKQHVISKLTPTTLKKVREFKTQIQKLMWENVGIIRTKNGLKNAFSQLTKIESKIAELTPKNTINQEIFELKNILTVATEITKSALKRKKSLGTHFISD